MMYLGRVGHVHAEQTYPAWVEEGLVEAPSLSEAARKLVACWEDRTVREGYGRLVHIAVAVCEPDQGYILAAPAETSP